MDLGQMIVMDEKVRNIYYNIMMKYYSKFSDT